MSESILTSTKKVLGIAEDYTVFDSDIIMHINSVFADLNQLGIGPGSGFAITDAAPLWSTYLNNELQLNSVRSYMYLRVKLLFDPPTSSYLISALEKQAKEMEWRLNVVREMRDHPYVPDDFDPRVDAADLAATSGSEGEVLTVDNGEADWEPITRVLVLDPGELVPEGTLPGTVILRRS